MERPRVSVCAIRLSELESVMPGALTSATGTEGTTAGGGSDTTVATGVGTTVATGAGLTVIVIVRSGRPRPKGSSSA